MKLSMMVADRYRIVRELGAGSSGTSYEALDVRTDTAVVVKELSLRAAAEWKSVELFEREAETLARVDHPSIPRFRQLVRLDEGGDQRLLIVRDLVRGTALSSLVKEGWRPGEAELRVIAAQVLHVLAYLHELAPPVVHRDVKPENLIRGPDGRVSLVDFGSVQRTDGNGSTIAGTFGYMAPEQFRGAAVAASDLYGLGATLVYMLSGRTPSELPMRRLALQFHEHVRASKELVAWLDRMVAPQLEDRFPSARAALRALRPPPRRRPLVALAIAGLVVAAAGVSAIALSVRGPRAGEGVPIARPKPIGTAVVISRPTATHPVTRPATTDLSPFAVAVDSSSVYWISLTGVYKEDKYGGAVTPLASSAQHREGNAAEIAVDGTYFYWTNDEISGPGSINRVPKQGGPVTTLALEQIAPAEAGVEGQRLDWVPGETLHRYTCPPIPERLDKRSACPIAAMSVDETSVYWVGPASYSMVRSQAGQTLPHFNEDAVIHKVAKDGGAIVNLASDQSASILALDRNAVYWVNADGTVDRVGKDGGKPVTLAAGQGVFKGLAVDGSGVYWASEDDGAAAIHMTGLNGGAVTKLASCPHSPTAIALDSTRVYWTDVTTDDHVGGLYAAEKGGGPAVRLAAANPGPKERRAMAADDVAVYWADLGTSHVETASGWPVRVGNHDGNVWRLNRVSRTPVALTLKPGSSLPVQARPAQGPL